MFSSYFRIVLRNFKKDKVSSVINIAGLAVGVTCFIVLALFIMDELSYDRFYKNADQVYRIYIKQNINGVQNSNSKTPGPLGPELLESYPEVLAYTRIGYFGNYLFRHDDKVFREGSIYAVDSSFFDVFSLEFIYGNPKTALTQPNTIVITESAAKKYFGNENPVGKILRTERSYTADYLLYEPDKGKRFYSNVEKGFLITGLIKDFPANSHFGCDLLTSMATYKVNDYWLDAWFSTYVLLKEGTDPGAFEKNLEKVVKTNVGPAAEQILGITLDQFYEAGNEYGYYLQPLTSIYLYSTKDYGIDLNTEWGNVRSSDVMYIYVFSAVAIFILLIAVINFMNLATARSERRAKEVGIRKTLGSNKVALIKQFISESILMSFISVLIALALLEIVLPLFNNLAGRNLHLDLVNNFYTVPALIGFILFVGILAGSYPAFYLSSFKPVQVLKTNFHKSSRKSVLRSTLVIIQFAISITLLIGTIIIKNQLDFIQSKNLGFNKESLISIVNADHLGNRIDAFEQELKKNPNIVSISSTSPMFRSGVPGNGYLFNKKSGTDPISFQYIETDYDFLKTFQIKMKEGRFFSKDFSTDTSAVVVNEAALREFDGEGRFDPVGKELTRIGRTEWAQSFNIIGVIKDFNYESLHQKIRPLAIHLLPEDRKLNILAIRLAAGDVRSTLNFIESTWKKISGEGDMYYRFVDDSIQRLYITEQRTSVITTVFSSLAIFIACLGLFGLAAFVTEQKTKEICIRKVMGASVAEILMILSKEFAVWVLISNIIAWPIAFYIMKNWLENFAFRININFTAFLISGATALVIALLTVSLHAVKASLANPVDSLRNE